MKKITIELKQFQKLGRMSDFTTANRNRFVPGTPAAEAAPAVTSAVENLNALTASQASLENRLRELSRAKADARTVLYDEMEFLYHTARSIAAETPGFDDKFRMRLKGDPRLLNAARSAVEDAVPLSDIFIKNAMPPNFLVALKAAIQTFKRTSEEYANGLTACSIGEKALRGSLDAAIAAAQRFNGIMRNTFRDDPIILGAWKNICRIQRSPRTKKAADSKPDGPQPQPVAQPLSPPAA